MVVRFRLQALVTLVAFGVLLLAGCTQQAPGLDSPGAAVKSAITALVDGDLDRLHDDARDDATAEALIDSIYPALGLPQAASVGPVSSVGSGTSRVTVRPAETQDPPTDSGVGANRTRKDSRMDARQQVLDAMRDAGKPVSAGELAEATGLDRKVVDKAMADLKKEAAIVSPVRCKWEPA